MTRQSQLVHHATPGAVPLAQGMEPVSPPLTSRRLKIQDSR